MAHYPKKTIFTPSSAMESPRIEHQQSLFTQSPSLPRPHSIVLGQMSPLVYENTSRITSSKLLSSGSEMFVPRVVTMNREALETLTETNKGRSKSPFIRLELLEKKNLLLEEENKKLLEINDRSMTLKGTERIRELNEENSRVNYKMKALQEENRQALLEVERKKIEVENLENLLRVHQEQHNKVVSDRRKEIEELNRQLSEIKDSQLNDQMVRNQMSEEKEAELIKTWKEKNEQLREEQNKVLAKLKEVTAKYEESVQKNQDLDQYYARTMLEYKAEIASIRSQYDTKIQTLTISKEKFNEYVTASRYEMDHLRRELKEKNEEVEKLQAMISTPLQTESIGNICPSDLNYQAKRYNIDDFGEKISNLLQENEKLNEKVALIERESTKWRTKCASLEDKLNAIHISSKKEKYYLHSEPDCEEDGVLKEKNMNNLKNSTTKKDGKSQSSVNLRGNSENKRPSYKLAPRNNKINNVHNLTIRGSSSKENIEWGQVRVLKQNNSGLGAKMNKLERNLSYSIRKNY